MPPWEQCTAKNAPLPSAERAFPLSPVDSSARERLNDRMRWLQGLELLVTVLLARNRQPPTVAAGVPRAELAAELLSLPSGLLAMVCEAIVKLKVRWGGCLCMRGVVQWGRRGPDACTAAVTVGYGAVLTSRVRPSMAECWQYCESYHEYSAGFRRGQTPPQFAAYRPFAS